MTLKLNKSFCSKETVQVNVAEWVKLQAKNAPLQPCISDIVSKECSVTDAHLRLCSSSS